MNTLNWINGAEEEGFARLRVCGSLIIGGIRVWGVPDPINLGGSGDAELD